MGRRRRGANKETDEGLTMKKTLMTALVTAAISVTAAQAADLGKMVTKAPPPPVVSPWDVAFGAAIMTDYNFRGISQSDRGPSVNAYFEPRYNISDSLQLYIGLAGSSVKLAQDPTMELDVYGGIRPTFGPLALDFGAIYYAYPQGDLILYPNGNISLQDQSFFEVYGKGVYTFSPMFAVGANVYYSPSWLNTGADGTYVSGTAKFTAPSGWLPSDWGAYINGEVGRYMLGTPDFDAVVYATPDDFPDYTYWNVGFGFTYKVFTLDLRYHDTDLSKEDCNILTGDPGAVPGGAVNPLMNPLGNQSNWCGSAFIAKLSVDTSLSALK
jgi:uncharacterized protein (TIGR02001 family)